MNTKTLIGFIVVIAVLGGAAYYVGRSGNGTIGPPPPPTPPPPPPTSDQKWKALLAEAAGPPRGNPKAPWTLIECGDFECPNCGKAKPMLEQFVEQSNGQVKLYFVNFPLNNIHKHAEEAAEASLAASAQGKFWPMYDMLYGDQDALVASEIEYHAANIPGLDVKRFTDEMTTRKYAKLVQGEEVVVTSAGVNVTPTFLLRKSTGDPKRKVYAYIGMQHTPKTHALSDLVQHPPWISPPDATSTVAAKPAGS